MSSGMFVGRAFRGHAEVASKNMGALPSLPGTIERLRASDHMTVCPMCQQPGTLKPVCEKLLHEVGLPIRCLACGGAYFKYISTSVIENDYWGGDPINESIYSHETVRAGFQEKYLKFLRLLDRHCAGPSRTLLEIGCGNGIFLELAAKGGWDVHGLDVDPQAVALVRKRLPEIHVQCSTLQGSGYDEEVFDAVALWDVIEHVDEPERLLDSAVRVLRPGGVLIVETPDEGCLMRSIVRFMYRATSTRINYLPQMYYAAHKWYFSRKSMTALLGRIGLISPRFFREQTVKALRVYKTTSYGARRTVVQQLVNATAEALWLVPLFRNKMVVLAVKELGRFGRGRSLRYDGTRSHSGEPTDDTLDH